MATASGLLAALLCASAAAGQTLPAPVYLRVEALLESAAPVLVVSTTTPRFSFLPHSTWDHPGRGVNVTSYRIVVTDSDNGTTAWDSGVVAVPGILPAQIACGASLAPLHAYTWTAQWWSGEASSPVSAPASFEVGPVSEANWAGARWVGGGQNEFRVSFALPPAGSARTRLFVAAPGGAVVRGRDGQALGDDAGVSAWVAFAKTVLYDAYALPTGAGAHMATVEVGRGFYVDGSFACKPPLGANGFCGTAPAARVLLVVTPASGSAPRPVPLLDAGGAGPDAAGASATVEGRQGAVLSDDPWLGSTIDWGLAPDAGWGPASDVPDVPPGRIRALQIERAQSAGWATSRMPVQPVNVTRVSPSTWHYAFSRNIVGHVRIRAGSFTGPGNISVNHCEVMNGTACSGLARLWTGLGTDVHMLPPNLSGVDLSPRFTWHGFQHVLLTVSGGATFCGDVDALEAVWTVANVAESGTIDFEGPGSELLAGIRDITKASQLGNMAGFIPTDCPTREKHGWLGDAQVTAEEAMYNLFSQPIYELFLDVIRDDQITNGTLAGFVPIVVPGSTSKPDDISWTAAYPLIANWVLQYYGDTAAARAHWPALKQYADGQLRVARQTNGSALPTFWQCGDWCAVEPRAQCTPGTGPAAAGANFLFALEAMVSMATALGEADDAARYAADLTRLRQIFDFEFWNDTLKTYSNDPLESQTLTSVALGAGAVPASRHAAAVAALTGDVRARGNHLTVGSAGQKWLLRELTAEGAHDTALRVALQTTEPSWGYWISKGATTCWESWSGVEDGSHPGDCYNTGFAPGCVPNPPTHNHIFLCGGVGEWMYRSLGGISPAAPGYARVSVSPEVSKTVGPTGVNSTVATVRGTVSSRWTRDSGGDGLTLDVVLPAGVVGDVSLPLLSASADVVTVVEAGGDRNVVVWDGPRGATAGLLSARDRADADAADVAAWLLSAPAPDKAADGNARLRLTVASGRYVFKVARGQGKQ